MPFLRGETMTVTEWDLEEYGRRQLKYKQKRHYPIHTAVRRGGDGLNLDEVIARAYELYPDRLVTPAAARTWGARDMLESPTIQSFGRGRGTRAHYPLDTAAQMATAAAMMDRWGYTQKQIALARKFVLEGVPVEDMPDVVDLLTVGRVQGDGNSNVVPLPSVEAVKIAGAVQAYAIALATARAGRRVTRPVSPCFHKRQWTQDGKQVFSYFASVLGYYIDPRGTEDITDIAADLDQQIRQQREEIRRKRNTDF